MFEGLQLKFLEYRRNRIQNKFDNAKRKVDLEQKVISFLKKQYQSSRSGEYSYNLSCQLNDKQTRFDSLAVKLLKLENELVGIKARITITQSFTKKIEYKGSTIDV